MSEWQLVCGSNGLRVLSFVPVVASIVAAPIVIPRLFKSSNLDAIPTIGSNSWFGSWLAGYKFYVNAIDLIQEGYEKYNRAPFKITDISHWIVVLSSRQHVEEIRKAPDDVLSLREAKNDEVKLEYTMGSELFHNPYHIEVVRAQLTRSINTRHPEIIDEISAAFEESLGLKDNEWKGVPAINTIQQVVCRTSNRMFVGLPLCRNKDWVDLNIRHTIDIFLGALVIRQFPRVLSSFITNFVTNIPKSRKEGTKLLGPIIEERLKLQEEYGKDWADKPNDLLSWMLDEAPDGPERTAELLTARVLSINVAAIHTTSNSFGHALFLLAANPQYIQPLRDEVDSVVEKEGWSKASLGKMYKIDSFLRETQRVIGIGAVSMTRKALKDFTFSDGTFIPKGTRVVAPALPLHLDDQYYDNAQVFDPFRFSNMRDGGEGAKHQFASTSPEYLPFGHGKHACPGRFFAVTELKTMLAHVVATYDVKLEDNQARPKEIRFGVDIAADQSASVMFRKRV
ncbi:cytochrome P450 [Chiua virens]|nr:cytochrome P450 [Chiua virens]